MNTKVAWIFIVHYLILFNSNQKWNIQYQIMIQIILKWNHVIKYNIFKYIYLFKKFNILLKECSLNGYPLCRGCGKEIFDKYYSRVNETSWHEECLKCSYCNINLFSDESCFIKRNKIMCKLDYYK